MRIIFFLLFFISIKSFSQKIYLHCGQLLDIKNEKMLKEKTIIINDNLIEKIVDGYLTIKTDEAANIKIIDLKNKVVLPGLIDMHVHLESEFHKNSYIERFTKNEADIAFQSIGFAKKTLEIGFTTVRDLGGTGVNTALRNAINEGKIIGPRVFSADKSIATTGGHADPTNGHKRLFMGDPGPNEGVINGVDDAKKAVRQRYKNGADLIKITATGGVMSLASNGSNPQFTIEEIKAITSTAKDYGMHVAAHAHGDEGIQRAILGGVTTIEHGTYMSDSTINLMIQNQVFYVPTVTAGAEVTEKSAIKDYYPPMVAKKAAKIGPQIKATLSKAYKKGVKIAFGTDAGVFEHGNNLKEFLLMSEAGMSSIDILKSATLTPASILKMEDKIGSLDEGKYADIIAVDGDPLLDIKKMTKVSFVMKEGKIFKN